MRNCRCGNQVADNARACPKCGHRFTGGFTKFVAWACAVFFGLIFLVVTIDSYFDTPSAAPTPTPSASTAAPSATPTKSMLTPAEKIYFGAALSYLKTANSQGTKLATTMAGASDGSSTLGDIKAALSSAKRIENAGYVGDYYERTNGNVPQSCKGISKDIDEVHRLFQSGIKETLEYWKDQNTEHIVSGNAAIQRSAVLMNATINKTGEKMKQQAEGK
jgi:hypothetical protein